MELAKVLAAHPEPTLSELEALVEPFGVHAVARVALVVARISIALFALPEVTSSAGTILAPAEAWLRSPSARLARSCAEVYRLSYILAAEVGDAYPASEWWNCEFVEALGLIPGAIALQEGTLDPDGDIAGPPTDELWATVAYFARMPSNRERVDRQVTGPAVDALIAWSRGEADPATRRWRWANCAPRR